MLFRSQTHRCRADPKDVGSTWYQTHKVLTIENFVQIDEVVISCHDNGTVAFRSWQEPNIHREIDPNDWAKHAHTVPARVRAPKENPNLNNPLNSLSTKNILFYSIVVHAQCCQLCARAQTDWVEYQNKIRQT